MESWKQAVWIAKFELKKSLKGNIVLLSMLFCYLIFFVPILPSYLEKGFVGFDLFFLMAFGIAPFLGRSKEFQLQKVGGDIWASPFFITLNGLPIMKDVLIKSRIVVNISYSIPFYVMMLGLLYALSPDLRMSLPFHSYLVFSIIWICIGINLGTSFPAADVGDKVTMLKTVLVFVLVFIGLFIVLTVFTLLYEDGLVGWTMMVAEDWPILSIIVSFILTVLGFRYMKSYMLKKMQQIDYLK